MAVSDFSAVVAPLAACVIFGAGLTWQLLRRKNSKPKKTVSRERIAARKIGTPNEDPTVGAVEKTKEVQAFDSVNVKRPTMLAVTTIRGDATAAEVFIQRAFKIDREHWRELDVSAAEKKNLDCLFANACKLAWVPGSNFERHIYAVSFSPVLEEALKQGFHPRVNATAADLQFCAIDETGTQLGEPMSMPDHEWGQPARVHALWCALNPSDKPHELSGELFKEVKVLQDRVAAIGQYVSAVTERTWKLRMDNILGLAHDMRRLGAETGQAVERNAQTDELVRLMLDEAKRIDALVDEHTQNVKNIDDADDALVHAIAYMHVRELTVRVLRICALLRVMGGDTFEHEVRSANRITSNVKTFTDVKPLIAAAEAIAHATLESGAGKTLVDSEMARVGQITRHANELKATHDELVAQLEKEAFDIQEQIDKFLLLQSRPRRYAVRVDDYGHVEKLMVLEH